MTPKEKAEELYNKYAPYMLEWDGVEKWAVKECSLIAVDECIESTKQLIHHYTKGNDERYASMYLSMSLSVQYWIEVKQEIEKL